MFITPTVPNGHNYLSMSYDDAGSADTFSGKLRPFQYKHALQLV